MIAGRGERGFTFAGVLLVIDPWAQAWPRTARSLERGEREKSSLCFRSNHSQAIRAYTSAPLLVKHFRKARTCWMTGASIAHALRRIYADPMTVKREWVLVEARARHSRH